MPSKRNYRDSLFRAIFKNKRALLTLYNALTGDTLTDPQAITINTLKGVLFNSLRNDLSFQVGDRSIVLLEEQSTENGNMPLRMLLYVSQIYRRIVSQKALYQRKTTKLPAPQFYVLYNGPEDLPVQDEYRLSDAFNVPSKDLELVVHFYNVTAGKDSPLFAPCPVLQQYSAFIDKVQAFIGAGLSRDEAIYEAIEYALKNDILEEFLQQYHEEVYDMISLKWDNDLALEVAREEARADGLAEGRAEGMAKGEEKGEKNLILSLLSAGTPLSMLEKAKGWTRERLLALAQANNIVVTE